MRDAGADHVVLGLVLGQHQVHGPDVVAREAPVPAGPQGAQPDLPLVAQLDLGHAERHLAADEFRTAPGRLVVEQDPGHRVHAVGLAVVLGQEMPVGLGHAVRAARVERGLLGLRGLTDLAEHLRRRRLVEADLPVTRGARRADPAAHPDRFQHPEHAQPGHLAGQLGLLPGHGHVGDRGQVVDLVRLHPFHRRDQAALIEQVTADQPDILQQLADPADPRVGLAADQAPHLVALGQQVFRKIGAVLPGDPGDQCTPRQRSLLSSCPSGYVGAAYRPWPGCRGPPGPAGLANGRRCTRW